MAAGPEEHGGGDEEHQSGGQGVFERIFAVFLERDPHHRRRDGSDRQKTNHPAVAPEQLPDSSAIEDQDRQQRPDVQNDIDGELLLQVDAILLEDRREDDQMAGRANRQEFRYTLDDGEEDDFE